jgi:uncharacterized protein
MQDLFKKNATSMETQPLPRAQKVLLVVFVILYPAIQCLLNYINPTAHEAINSRILELYIPSLFLQILVFLSIILAIIGNRENLQSLGVKPSDFTLVNLGIGVAFLFVAVIILNIFAKMLSFYGLYATVDLAYLLPKTRLERLIWMALAISAGISEEICFRGFIISRIAKLTGAIWPGVILSSLAFGISHSYQGVGGMIIISVYGLMFSLLFLARGSLVPCIIAHALQDIIASFGM